MEYSQTLGPVVRALKLQEGELYVPRGTDGSWNSFDDPARRTHLGSDVCSFGFVPRYDNVLSFFSPCETRRLNVWRALSDRDFEEEAANVYPLAENTIAPQQIQVCRLRTRDWTAENDCFYYVTNPDQGAPTGAHGCQTSSRASA